MKKPSDKIVTIIGGSGFIGRYITRRLTKAGYRVRVAVRRPDLAVHVQPNGGVGQVFPIQTNVRYPNSVEAAVKGADYVINLAGILDEGGKQKFTAVNVEGAKTVAKMATKHGVEKLIHFSTLNVAAKQEADDPDTYISSNYEGELQVKAAFSGAIIVRPSLVFGPEDRLFNLVARFAKLKRIIAPVFSELAAKSEPIYVDDIAKAMVALLEGDYENATFELGGPRILTMQQITELTLHATNRDIKIIQVPKIISSIFASICTMLPYSWITKGEVELYSQDQLISDKALMDNHVLADLDIEARHCEEIILQYLQHYRPEGDYGIHDLKQE